MHSKSWPSRYREKNALYESEKLQFWENHKRENFRKFVDSANVSHIWQISLRRTVIVENKA